MIILVLITFIIIGDLNKLISDKVKVDLNFQDIPTDISCRNVI